jgi:hypothetical protein
VYRRLIFHWLRHKGTRQVSQISQKQ